MLTADNNQQNIHSRQQPTEYGYIAHQAGWIKPQAEACLRAIDHFVILMRGDQMTQKQKTQ